MTVEQRLTQLLTQHFGFQTFRPGQLAALTELCAGRDTLALLPTGAGKTLIYELYGYYAERLVVVVSPLISLMQDQVATMAVHGEKRAAALTSVMGYGERQWLLAHLNQYRYLFVSPEMLSQSTVLTAIQRCQPGLLVIDEAHCISTWGPDFRPEYLLLGTIRKRLGSPLTLMTTATATANVKQDILRKLAIKQPAVVALPVERDNIFLTVKTVTSQTEKDEQLVSLVAALQQPGVIYFSSKQKADEMAVTLTQKTGREVAAYHADLAPEERFKVQQQFMQDRIDVICATSAFGMGIDKNNVRFVIHYHLPGDLESYWQEIGRAGRDGAQSLAVLLYQPGDEQIADYLSQANLPEPAEIRYYYQAKSPAVAGDQHGQLVQFYRQHHASVDQVLNLFDERRQQRQQALQRMLGYVRTTSCRRHYIQRYFDQTTGGTVTPCCDVDEPDWQIKELGLQQVAKTVSIDSVDWRTTLAHLFH